ncbi:M23 family metallopeptidase [Labedella populi]|uniref:M23 family metallopeptidase n=1 Tax=Labedella populi TaxID=2498850 RepID=UPI002691853F
MSEPKKPKRGSVFRWRSRRARSGDTSRRQVLALGAVGVFTAAGVVAGVTPAWAAKYPSWDDVQKAKRNQAAAAAQVTNIKNLIAGLEAEVASTQAEAERKGQEYFEAQQAFDDAVVRAEALQGQADEKKVEADESIAKAGQVAAQLYRSGGSDVSLSLFFDSSASPDALLGALGTMSKLLEHNKSVYDQAVNARNTAQSLSDQASAAREERERLRALAEEAMIAAQAAADAAVAALEESQNKKVELEAQLAALEDTTAETVEGYKKGVEEERKRREAAEKAAREKAAREAAAAAAAAAEAAKNSNSGGGSGGGSSSGGGGSSSGGGGGGSGWRRPCSGWISSGYGVRNSPGGIGSRNHPGVDIANGSGTPLYAASSGTVTYAGWNGGYGYFIRISHGGGVTTAYGHIRSGGDRRPERPERERRSVHRCDGQHRQFDRTARALRDARQRRGAEPGTVHAQSGRLALTRT